MSTCKNQFRTAIAYLYFINSLLIGAISLLFIALMVNNNFWTWLVTWVWIMFASILVMAAWFILDNIQALKPHIIKLCMHPKCGPTHFNRYFFYYNRYKTFHNWVIGAIGVAFAASFAPFSASIPIFLALMFVFALTGLCVWMIQHLRALLRCLK